MEAPDFFHDQTVDAFMASAASSAAAPAEPPPPSTDNNLVVMLPLANQDGAKDGHRNGPWATGSDVGKDREFGPCWIYDHSQVGDYYLGTYTGSHNLTWSEAKTGQPVPSNVYKIGDIVLARNLGTETNPRSWVGNIMPGRVEVAGGVLGQAEWDDCALPFPPRSASPAAECFVD